MPARFLTPAKFRARVTTDEKKLSKSDKRDLAIGEAELRSLALVSGGFDLFGSVNDEAGAGIVAYYDDEKEEMVIRGKRIDPEAKVTIAHELTHTLQDQHYDLAKLSDHVKTNGADDAVTALVEGDATVVENDYYWHLARADRRKVDRAEEAQFGTEPDSGAAPDAPDIVAATMDAPYALGPWMVTVVQDARGRRGLADEFGSPPRTQLDYLLPTTAVKPIRPRQLAAPKAPDRARRLQPKEPNDFGAFDLYLLLASRIPFPVALQAADGWGNGRETLSRKDGTVCADVRVVGHDHEASKAIGRALTSWGAAVGPTPVTVDAARRLLPRVRSRRRRDRPTAVGRGCTHVRGRPQRAGVGVRLRRLPAPDRRLRGPCDRRRAGLRRCRAVVRRRRRPEQGPDEAVADDDPAAPRSLRRPVDLSVTAAEYFVETTKDSA